MAVIGTAIVGLGSSLGDRVETIRAAVNAIESIGSIDGRSRLYDTAPTGGAREPFVNAAVRIRPSWTSPRTLLKALLEIERGLGRRRGPTVVDRTIDLDLLFAFAANGEAIAVDEPGLRVPHPRIAGRDFALGPVCDLDAGIRLPDGRTAARALADLDPEQRSILRVRVETL
jgi:2-amino-4-hydroxy-6-hydroxymethyldihydropteridine diphosphokinase